jgi:hypothetical protein
MRKHLSMALLLALAPLLALTLTGCSSDDPAADPTGPAPTVVQFSDYAAAMAAVIPSEFQAVAKSDKIAGQYAMWTEGQYPILGKAIGSALSDEPMSVYRNLNTLQWTIESIEGFALLGEGASSIEGPDGVMYPVTIVIDDLTAAIAVPTECRAVIGADEIALERAFKVVVQDVAMVLHLGYAQTEQAETIVVWQDEQGQGNAFSVATKNLVSGAISIRGAFYKVTEQETASWIYDIATAGADNTEFVYNMAWYSDQMGDASGLSCVSGSGDKNASFGLRYHQYRAPWVRGEYDVWGPYQQLFGPGGGNPYADLNVGGEYPAEQAALIDEAGMFVYDDMPHDMFASPFGQ